MKSRCFMRTGTAAFSITGSSTVYTSRNSGPMSQTSCGNGFTIPTLTAQ